MINGIKRQDFEYLKIFYKLNLNLIITIMMSIIQIIP